MSAYDFDLFVIGAGSGGVKAARMSAGLGARVAIAEEYRIGGTCVIRGCVPKKLFVYAARFDDAFKDARGFGWSIDTPPRFDWPTLIANKDREIDRLNGLYTVGLERAGVRIYKSRAELVGPHEVHLAASGERITAGTILIATGAHPFVPDIPGVDLGFTSNEAFHLSSLPASIAIVGGGYIALEFASIFNGLGVDVTVLYRGPQILRGFDDDIRNALAEGMRGRGIDIRVEANPAAIREVPGGRGREVVLTSGDVLEAGAVMLATGRVPNTVGLGLQALGVTLGWNGHVVVDEYSRSSIGNIYAVGDVTHRVNLTPVAIHEGIAFAETVFNDNPTPVDHGTIPTAVFSEPEIGTVGVTEAEARERCRVVDIYEARFRPMLHTLSGRDEKMLMKLIVDGESDRVLGCHIMGPDAAEIVQMAAIAMRMGARKADFDATMALHPSAAEELVTMRDKRAAPGTQAAE